MKTKIILVGATGRMGKEIEKLIEESEDFELLYRVAEGLADDAENRSSLSTIQLGEQQAMVIDFSTASLFRSVVNWCRENKVPLVSGTTGINVEDRVNLENAGKTIPVLWSSNMSMGINLLRKVIAQLGALRGFDFQIEDFHHNKKIDAPSGTAVTLQEDLEAAVEQPVPPVVSIRAGGIFGIHKIHAVSAEEHIILEHQALNRTVFARGALFAARWLSKKQAGYYQMIDALQV